MIRQTTCCGLREFSGLRPTASDTLVSFLNDTNNNRSSGCFYLFSGTKDSCIDDLYDLIRAGKLGRVQRTAYRRNPNSGNKLRVLVFEPNYQRCALWLEDKENRKIEKMFSVAVHRSFRMSRSVDRWHYQDNSLFYILFFLFVGFIVTNAIAELVWYLQ